MDNEKVVRDEADYSFTTKISGKIDHNAIDKFHQLKERLIDFYSNDLKAIFPDQIKIKLDEQL
ncbi:MAG TPA: hypothetical protein VGI82_09880 [Chitinophagaceae bacterium]